MTSPKLCKDCKHYMADNSGASWDRCKKRSLTPAGLELVRGDPPAFGFCERTRSEESFCGAKGLWWEPK